MAPPPGAPTFQLAGMQPEVLAQAQLPPVAPNAVLAPNETRRLAALAAVSPDRRAVLLRKACVAYEEARKQVQELTSKLEAMPKQAAELQARLQAAYTDSALPTEAQAKANSLRRAKGSAFSGRRVPLEPMISNLYGVPGSTSGAKISHTPESERNRIMCRRPSQLLKLPTTETRRAFGAHTAK